MLQMLYNTLIQPYLAYCNIIWGTAKASALNPLFLLQKRVIRICAKSDFRAPSGPLFSKLRILNIFDLNKYLTMLFMFKYMHNLLPISCNTFIKLSNTVNNYSLRNVGFLRTEKFNTSCRENCISIRGPKLWNSFSNLSLTSFSIGLFKKQLTVFFFSSYVVS